MKAFGRYLSNAISTAALVIGLAITGADAVASNIVQVPDNATYLGNQMGGSFVVLERHDIRTDAGGWSWFGPIPVWNSNPKAEMERGLLNNYITYNLKGDRFRESVWQISE
ncbi:MAG: hypothetical protein P8N68_07805 [Paracoccaceae bacterium]|nr:hypothetical protein [Paracoccaceae bacterium]